MNRNYLVLFAIIVIAAYLIGAYYGFDLEYGEQINIELNETENESEQILLSDMGINITLKVYLTNRVERVDLSVPEGSTLFYVMKQNLDLEYEMYEEWGAFITSINGLEQHDNYYWVFDVNREHAQVGASFYVLEQDDKIEWKLEQY